MKNLDPKAVWLFFFSGIFVLPFVMLPVYFFISFFLGFFNAIQFGGAMSPGFIVLGVFALFLVTIVFNFIWSRLSYKNYKYELRADGFRKEHGVISKKYVTIPYERIQNVDIFRGLIARLLGLSDLNIQTAGMSGTSGSYGGASEGRLPGLNPQVAEQLRDELIARARGKHQGI